RSLARQETLRVELHSVQRPGLVTDAHDFALVGPGADHKIGMLKGFALDHQAVVAGRFERVGQPAKNALPVMVDPRRLAVHDPVVAQHLTTKDMPDALMPQTYAQHRYFRSEALDHVVGHTGLARRTRAGRDDDVTWLQFFDLVHAYLIVPMNLQVDSRIQLPQALHQVVRERIVVVDEKNHETWTLVSGQWLG